MTGPRRNMIGLHLAPSAVTSPPPPLGHTRSDDGPPVIFVTAGTDRTYVEEQIRRLAHELDALFPEIDRLGEALRQRCLTIECNKTESMFIAKEEPQERRTPKQPWYAKFQKQPSKKSRARSKHR